MKSGEHSVGLCFFTNLLFTRNYHIYVNIATRSISTLFQATERASEQSLSKWLHSKKTIFVTAPINEFNWICFCEATLLYICLSKTTQKHIHKKNAAKELKTNFLLLLVCASKRSANITHACISTAVSLQTISTFYTFTICCRLIETHVKRYTVSTYVRTQSYTSEYIWCIRIVTLFSLAITSFIDCKLNSTKMHSAGIGCHKNQVF